MATYLLVPRPALLGHPDWAFSTQSGAVSLEAESETWARILATAAHLLVGESAKPKSPWMSEDLVAVREVSVEVEMLEAA